MALFVRKGGSRHTGQAAPPQRNIQNVIRYDFIEHFINELAEKYHILEIAVDR